MTNLQGDVTAILGQNGYVMVEYTYDAWGNLLTTTGSLANSLGKYNPLRYRGYIYDYETGLYYLQSRYYNPEMGRFLNADIYAATGQGLLGNNMFAYCQNNPIRYIDYSGEFILEILGSTALATTVLVVGAFAASYFAVKALVTAVDFLATTKSKLSPPSFENAKAGEVEDVAQDSISIQPPSPNNNDDDDDYYDDDSNFGGNQKIGKPKGKTPGNNQAQNKQFRDATKGLSPSEQRAVHDQISKKGFGYHEIQKIAKNLKQLKKGPF